MMSSMSYSPQPEYFARSLKRRLQSLTPEGVTRTSPPIDIETDAAENGSEVIAASDISGNKENRIRKILERGLRTCDGYVVKLSPNFPATGTTFPPNRFINEDQLRAKFHSDSDFHSQLKSRRHDKADASRSAADFRHVNGEDDGDDHPAVADICDSDLFFDFDIGSPEQPDSDEDHLINHVNEIGGNDRDISPTIIGKASDLPAIMHSPDHSTAYGSTTSGIFSDQDTPSPSDVDENERLEQFVEGFSLNPEDWIKTQQAMLAKLDKSSSVTPTMSPHTRSPPASVAAAAAAASQSLEEPMITLPPVLTPPDSNDGTLSNGNESGNDNESTTEEESNSRDETASQSDDQDLKICIGSQEKSVAHSKLQSLLAQLEKGGSKSFSPPKKIHLDFGKDVIKTQVHSSSPANFSFLVGSMPNPDSHMSSIAKCIKSHSTPDMTELDKERCNSMSPRPQEDTSISEQLSTDSSGPAVEFKDEKKEVYRKCSSLRSGKTPPTTPGRRKIVRYVPPKNFFVALACHSPLLDAFD